jgi:hypothetical protein
MTPEEKDRIKMYLLLMGWTYDEADDLHVNDNSICWYKREFRGGWKTYDEAYECELASHTA